MSEVYLEIHIGNKDEHDRDKAVYDATVALLEKNASIYGLPSSAELLSEEQQSILQELDVLCLLDSSFDSNGLIMSTPLEFSGDAIRTTEASVRRQTGLQTRPVSWIS